MTSTDPFGASPSITAQADQERAKLTEDDRRWRLLRHYHNRPVTEYAQFDAQHQPGGDGLAVDDEDGDIVYATTSAELWHGYPVRVHIKRGVDTETAARLLRKIAAWIENGALPGDDGDEWPTSADGGAGWGMYR
jgi:hypothetical protein